MTDKPSIIRSVEEIQGDYLKLCQVSGEKQYLVQHLKAELDQINQQMFYLKNEFESSKTGQGPTEIQIPPHMVENHFPEKAP